MSRLLATFVPLLLAVPALAQQDVSPKPTGTGTADGADRLRPVPQEQHSSAADTLPMGEEWVEADDGLAAWPACAGDCDGHGKKHHHGLRKHGHFRDKHAADDDPCVDDGINAFTDPRCLPPAPKHHRHHWHKEKGKENCND